MSVPSQQGETPNGSPSRLNMPSSAMVNQVLQAYFQKKGYSHGKLAFLKQDSSSESNLESLDQLSKKLLSAAPTGIDESLLDYINLIKEDLNNGADLESVLTSYRNLKEWTENALDLYKGELVLVLYPIYIYTFLDLLSKQLVDYALTFFQQFKRDHFEDHKKDIEMLDKIKSTDDIAQNTAASSYLNKKFHIRMSSIPFDLFINYIQDNKLLNFYRIVNKHLHIHIVTGKLTPATGGEASLNTTNNFEEFHEINGVQLFPRDEDEVMEEGFNKVKEENLMDMMNLDEIAAHTYRSTDIQAEMESLADLRKRVSLGSAALPSVCIYTFHNTHDQFNCISISDDTTLIAAGSSESFIKIWSLKGEYLQSEAEKEEGSAGSYSKKLIGHSGPVFGISFSHDNEYLISCSEDQTVRLWSLKTYQNLVCYKNHNYPVWDVDFGPYGFYFATASHDKTARLWSCDHINPLRIFAGHLSDVNTVRFHPNSKYIVTGSSDKTARLWDVQRGTCVRVFTGHTGPVHTVAISPNGQLMASGGEDHTIILWDLGSGKKLKTMMGHTGFIYSVGFSSDSTTLVSGSADNTVRAWDVNKHTPYESSYDGMNSKRTKYDKMNGNQKDKKDADKSKLAGDKKKGAFESDDQLSVFPTKNTPIYTVKFTQRNLCLVAGALSSPPLDL